MLLSHSDLFTPVELKHRVFSKIPADARREQLVALAQAGNHVAEDQLTSELYLRAGAFDSLSVAQIVIDAKEQLVLANRRSKELFHLAEADTGHPLQDLELSCRPLELRSVIDQAYQEGRVIRVAEVERTTDGKSEYFEVEVTPLQRNGGTVLGESIVFIDRTAAQMLQSELKVTSERLEEANQAYHSTNEELETTNEELQSTNEELETINEELQATNEELRTMNDVMQERTRQTNAANAFLESVLAGSRSACIVIDRDHTVRIWKEKAEELWGLRAEEVEWQSPATRDIGLPVADLQGDSPLASRAIARCTNASWRP